MFTCSSEKVKNDPRDKAALQVIRKTVYQNITKKSKPLQDDIISFCCFYYAKSQQKLKSLANNDIHFARLVHVKTKYLISDYFRVHGPLTRGKKVLRHVPTISLSTPAYEDSKNRERTIEDEILYLPEIDALQRYMVQIAYSRLSPVDQEILTLRAVEQRSVAQIGRLFARTGSLVSQRYKRAVGNFKEQYLELSNILKEIK